MELGRATVFDVTIAKRSRFLYAICGVLENNVALYVGQTRGGKGALGRLAQHLSDTESNTYLQRLSSLYRHQEIQLERVDFAAITFSESKMFWIDNPEYRKAVEDLVQRRLLNWLREHRLKICIVSRTYPNAYCRLGYVEEEADRIASVLQRWIMQFHR
ncbi:MAG: hypothetical protein OXN17_10475 [Candidatus Poribacteria bacterium]|nr:hypothetical protein [Candidatus Poribacteria bacterium]MDE0503084.1 hypothetical protein [Candidatus Poribacteria bacterium]